MILVLKGLKTNKIGKIFETEIAPEICSLSLRMTIGKFLTIKNSQNPIRIAKTPVNLLMWIHKNDICLQTNAYFSTFFAILMRFLLFFMVKTLLMVILRVKEHISNVISVSKILSVLLVLSPFK